MVFRKISCIILLFVLIGCSNNTTMVTGTVKLADGKPLTIGFITYESVTTNVIGTFDEQGRFSLFQARPGDRVPPGTYRGAISYDISETGESRLPFPGKYTSFDTSGLTLTVEPGKPVNLEIVLE